MIGVTIGASVGTAVGVSVGVAEDPASLGASNWFDTQDAFVSSSTFVDRIGGVEAKQAVGTRMPVLDGLDLVFDGTDDRLSVVTDAFRFMGYGRPAQSDWCVYELVNFTSASATRNSVFCASRSDTLTPHGRGRVQASNVFSFQYRANGSSDTATANTSIATGQWYWVYYGIRGTDAVSRVKGSAEVTAAMTGSAVLDIDRIELGSRDALNPAHLRTRGAWIFPFWPSAEIHAMAQRWADARIAI